MAKVMLRIKTVDLPYAQQEFETGYDTVGEAIDNMKRAKKSEVMFVGTGNKLFVINNIVSLEYYEIIERD